MKYDLLLQDIFSLKNKTAIVTGASGFLGAVISKALYVAGANLIILGRDLSKLEILSKELRSLDSAGTVEKYSFDFHDEKLTKDVFKTILNNHNRIDILVNNAFSFSKETGFNDPSGKMEEISKEQWMNSLESGVYWHALTTQVVGERMKESQNGSIINISSMYAIVAPDPNLYEGSDILNPPCYGAAKAAILAFTRYTASFWGKYSIRCNALTLGTFPNIGGESYNSPRDSNFISKLVNKTVLKRVGVPEDIMGAIIFLASDASKYITGQSVSIDGGWSIV